MAQFNDDAPPPGYRYVYSGDPSGGGVRYLEPIADRSIPQATPEGEFIPTPPSVDQMKYELSQQAAKKSLPEFLANLPTEIRDQAIALGETGATFLGGMVSPVAAAAAALGKNVYDYFDKGQIDPKATKDFANEAARLFSYVPVTPAGQVATEAIGEAPAYIMGTGQGLPPLVSGINPRALQTAPVIGPLSAGVKRDISQFSNDVFNAQRGITPGYATLGSEFSNMFVTPRPTTYEMLAGIEPSRIPSTASQAVKPLGKGNTTYSLGEPLPSILNPSGMTGYIGNAWRRPATMPENLSMANNLAIDYKVEVRKLKPEFDFQSSLAEYERSLNSEGRKVYRDASTLERYSQFIDDWNAKNPNDKLPTLEQFVQANAATNAWMQGPGKTYMERQMGTGAKYDPVLGELEKSGVDPFYYFDRDYSADDAGRERAVLLHRLNPALNVDETDIGKQTATTRAGKIYENMTDALINPMSVESIQRANRGEPIHGYVHGALKNLPPEQLERLNKMPPHEVIYDLDLHMSTEPIDVLHEKLFTELLAGRIKPENINNVSAQRLMQMIIKDEQDRLKKEQGNKQSYAGYKQKFFDNVPASMVDKTTDSGGKFIRFDKNSPLSREDIIRGLCIDTKDLNHCVASGAHNTGDYKGYVPLVEPHTGKRAKGVPADTTSTSYINGVLDGSTAIISYRGPDGTPIATIQENVLPSGKVYISQIMSTNDGPIANADQVKEVRQWLNDNADRIKSVESGYGLGHVGHPYDLYSDHAIEDITLRHANIDPDALKELMDMAAYDRAMTLDYEFAEWFKKVTGEDIDNIVKGESFSNIVEAYRVGASNLLEQVKDRLSPEVAGSPEFIKFINDAVREDDLDSGSKDLAKVIGRFSTLQDIKDYAKSVGIDLNYPEVNIATASMHDLMKYATRLDEEIRQLTRGDGSPEDIDATRQRLDEVTARMNEIHEQQLKQVRDATKEILDVVPTDIETRLGRINAMPNPWKHLLVDSMQSLRFNAEIGIDKFGDATGPLRQQLEILYGSPENNVLTENQSNLLLSYLISDRIENAIETINGKGPFNPSNGGTLEQSKQAAQIIANWAKYRLENPDASNYGVQPRAENAVQPAVEQQAARPQMNWDLANYLRDIWQEFDQNGYVTDVSPELTGFVNTILGNQDPEARLPRDVHWHIVRELANPNRNYADIADLRQLVANREGVFTHLTAGERINALNIIDEWVRINGIDLNPDGMAQGGQVRRMANGGAVKMQAGGKPDDDINALRPQAEPRVPTLRDIVADLGDPKNRELYENFLAGKAIKAKDLNPMSSSAIQLLNVANKTPDPDRYLETLNPYFDSQLNIDTRYNAFGRPNIGGFVSTKAPNIANIASLQGIENTVPHELEHTLQLGKGKDQQFRGDSFDANKPAQALYDRLNALDPEVRKQIAQGSNIASHPHELLANIAAYSALSHAKGVDFINTPEGKALFPNKEAQAYYYNAILPGVPSIYGYRENAGTEPYVRDPRDSYAVQALGYLKNKARDVIDRAEGGAVTDTLDKMVKNPQAATMLNLDLPNLVASRQQTKTLRRGGRVQFAHDLDQMRYEMTHRRG